MISKLIKTKYILVVIAICVGIVMFLPTNVSAMAVTIGIPEKYSKIEAGEKIYFETEVKWPENVGRKDLRIEYSAKDNLGNEVAYLKVLKAIETQASFMDYMQIPEGIEPGIYKIFMRISDYQDLNQEVAASFTINSNGDYTQTYLFLIIILLNVIIVFLITETIFMNRKRSNKFDKIFI